MATHEGQKTHFASRGTVGFGGAVTRLKARSIASGSLSVPISRAVSRMRLERSASVSFVCFAGMSLPLRDEVLRQHLHVVDAGLYHEIRHSVLVSQRWHPVAFEGREVRGSPTKGEKELQLRQALH
jgi:hypothetical protein